MPAAAIIGTGLIGASVGLGLRELGWDVAGWDHDPEALRAAVARGALDRAATSIGDAAAGAGIVVLALPPRATVAAMASIDPEQLVIDVAGVKGSVVGAVSGRRFVGTHPMAGREVSGPRAASSSLFKGATWVLTTDEARADDLALVEGIVVGLGARPVRMEAAAHDHLVAAVSHVPQLLAAALVAEAVEADGALDLAAGSFRDLTRVAASDPSLWIEVLRDNREAVHAILSGLRRRIDEFEASIDDPDRLHRLLSDARLARASLSARVTAVSVALADRPGELGKVGQALQESGVDVRDIQLRHAPHGGGGVLTISVRPGDGDRLRSALDAEGLLVID